MEFNQDENDLNNLSSFSQSLGTLFRQIGVYSIIQIIASFFLAFMTVGMLFSVVIGASMSEIFNVFQTSIWTILITATVLEIISYIFIIKLITLLFGAEKRGIPIKGKYRKSALFFIVGIILGIVLLVVSFIVANWLMQLIQGIFNDPLFEIEDLEQVPSSDIISTLAQVGRTGLSLAGFYFLKQNFEQLNGYMQNGRNVSKGLQLLVIGYLLQIIGDFLGLIVDLASFLGLIGLILTIVGYFKASNGLKSTIWSQIGVSQMKLSHAKKVQKLDKKDRRSHFTEEDILNSEETLHRYLKENEGKAFTASSLYKRCIEDKYPDISLAEVEKRLHNLYYLGRIHLDVKDNVNYYFI